MRPQSVRCLLGRAWNGPARRVFREGRGGVNQPAAFHPNACLSLRQWRCAAQPRRAGGGGKTVRPGADHEGLVLQHLPHGNGAGPRTREGGAVWIPGGQALSQKPLTNCRVRVNPAKNLSVGSRHPGRIAVPLGGARNRNNPISNVRAAGFHAHLHRGAPAKPHQ